MCVCPIGVCVCPMCVCLSHMCVCLSHMSFLFILQLLYLPPPKGEQKAAGGGLIASFSNASNSSNSSNSSITSNSGSANFNFFKMPKVLKCEDKKFSNARTTQKVVPRTGGCARSQKINQYDTWVSVYFLDFPG